MFSERFQCPLCGSSDIVSVYSRRYVGTEVEASLIGKYNSHPREQPFDQRFADSEYVVSECKKCRAYFQKYIPSNDLAIEYYNTWISQHGKPTFPFGEYTHHINEAMILTSLLLRHTGKTSPADLSVLDFGVGRGLFAMAMRACGCRVTAHDIATEREALARSNGMETISPEKIPGSQFDFINTEQVFEHLPEPRDTARLLTSGLNERGVLKISVPYAPWLEKGAFFIDWRASRYGKGSSMPLYPIEHLNYFRRPSMHTMMDSIGFSEVKLSALDELNYAFNWRGARNIMKNIVRPIARTRFRNYFLFSR